MDFMISSSPSEVDIYLFHEGCHYRSYQFLGSHLVQQDGVEGAHFALWAPRAAEVCVVGDFNNWQGYQHRMQRFGDSGIWTIFIPGIKEDDLYKYEIHTPQGEVLLKADPFAFFSELRPNTASKVCQLSKYQWQDADYQKRRQKTFYNSPMLIYEVHLGSWKRAEGHFLTFRELAQQLISYVVEMGYTHIELLPIFEHPLDASWGYQVTGYFSVTSRYGTPQDFMYFVDCCHQSGIGVILDWVPAHFCKDSHGLRMFDGSPLFEPEHWLKAENCQWGTTNFDFGKPEVISFLISNALFWLDIYHIDGLRVDAVAFMLYLDYGKSAGQWMPNQYGGRENLEAVAFMKKLNEAAFQQFPGALIIAEESTTWPSVTKPTYLGGLGYNYKWNMGWMNDLLHYMEMDPVHRKWHHNQLTFSFMYTYSENYILPLSHDEVVHGKRSLLNKMPGDYWQKFANLRLLYGYMIAHPGKKLLFMGSEFGQFTEWNSQQSLDWHLLEYDMHQRLHEFVKTLNHFYLSEPALWQLDHHDTGFQWIDPHDYSQSIITFIRQAWDQEDFIIIVCNFTPVVRNQYRIGVPCMGEYFEIFNSDLVVYGGSGQSNQLIKAEEKAWHNQPFSLEIKIPPLSVIFLKASDKKFTKKKHLGTGQN